MKFFEMTETFEGLNNIDIYDKEKLIKNDKFLYNVKYIPKTGFADLVIKKYKVKDNKNNPINKSFYLNIYKDYVILTHNHGEFYFLKTKNLSSKSTNQNFKKINNDLNKSKLNRILDTFIHDDKIYISLINEINNCQVFTILYAEFNLNNIYFRKFYESNECGEYVQAGRMKNYFYENANGLLVTTSDTTPDFPTNNAQDNSSIFGKILHINYLTKEINIISKGHRNSQGLFVEKDLILSTEHGPRGGDEINKIIVGGNYGWPITTYGAPYNEDKDNIYKKDHNSLGFIEPIFSFIPSIAISEIIKIPENFYPYNDLTNIFYITSLNGRSIYFVRFDKDYKRLIFIEKIFIGERIRDIVYLKNLNAFMLALEDTFSIQIINIKK
tara:strand:+ start:1462 stop:2613 length:1152 start_codon:yes stop_codon:yes gene_type:complete